MPIPSVHDLNSCHGFRTCPSFSRLCHSHGFILLIGFIVGSSSTAALYAEVRADAERHARARNAFFEQSQAAFRAGDGRLAKELGQKVWLLLSWLAGGFVRGRFGCW
jgi:hypothetical protein